MSYRKELAYHRLVKPVDDMQVRQWLSQLDEESYAPRDVDKNLQERWDRIKSFRQSLTTFASNFLDGLEEFPYFYVSHGNTEYINTLAALRGPLSHAHDDYSYYAFAVETFQRSAESSTPSRDWIFSYPSWGQGDEQQLQRALEQPSDMRKHMDVAYLGLTLTHRPVSVAPFDSVSISLSKSLAIPYNRVAGVFSRFVIPHWEVMHVSGYVNHAGTAVAEKLLAQWPDNYWIERYKEKYLNVCREKNFAPGNCILFARDAEGKRCSTAEYF